MKDNEKFVDKGDENNSDETEVSRRKAMSIVAAGVAGVLLNKVVSAQTPTPSPTPSQTPTPTPTPVKQITTVKADGIPDLLKKDVQLKKEPVKGLIDSKFDAFTFSRSEEEKAIWSQLLNSIEKDLTLTTKGNCCGDLNRNFLKIESGFKFNRAELDEEFLPTHIEPLIDQASDLLDRCLKDRANWDDLSVKMFNLALELNEYKELDKIHQEEERNGLYDVSWKQSVADYNAERTNSWNLQRNSGYLDWVINNHFSQEKINKIYGAIQLSSILQGMPPYYWKGQDFDSYGDFTWNGTKKQIFEHQQAAAIDYGDHSLFSQKYGLSSQKNSIDNLSDISNRRLEGLKARADWDRLNANFQRRRTVVAREIQDIKTKAAVSDNGVLNYVKRLVPLKQRFDKDFRNALARMKAAQQGLKTIYGYDFPLPSDETSVDFYDNCLIWTRSAVEWILKFTRKELNTIYPISLRETLGSDTYKNMRESGLWQFEINENHLPEMCNLRLRGISMCVKVDSVLKERFWQFQTRVPTSAKIRHYLTKKVVSIDQSFIEPVVLGRVTERDILKIPDVVGMTSLYNGSPLGMWQTRVLGALPDKSHEKIQDIQIDLHLAYRWYQPTP